MRNNLFLVLAALCLICVGRGFASDVDEKDVVVLGDKNFTDGLKNSKFALVRSILLDVKSRTASDHSRIS
jgi:hypothetical protein